MSVANVVWPPTPLPAVTPHRVMSKQQQTATEGHSSSSSSSKAFITEVKSQEQNHKKLKKSTLNLSVRKDYAKLQDVVQHFAKKVPSSSDMSKILTLYLIPPPPPPSPFLGMVRLIFLSTNSVMNTFKPMSIT